MLRRMSVALGLGSDSPKARAKRLGVTVGDLPEIDQLKERHGLNSKQAVMWLKFYRAEETLKNKERERQIEAEDWRAKFVELLVSLPATHSFSDLVATDSKSASPPDSNASSSNSGTGDSGEANGSAHIENTLVGLLEKYRLVPTRDDCKVLLERNVHACFWLLHQYPRLGLSEEQRAFVAHLNEWSRQGHPGFAHLQAMLHDTFLWFSASSARAHKRSTRNRAKSEFYASPAQRKRMHNLSLSGDLVSPDATQHPRASPDAPAAHTAPRSRRATYAAASSAAHTREAEPQAEPQAQASPPQRSILQWKSIEGLSDNSASSDTPLSANDD